MKLSFLIPCYKVKKYLLENKEMGIALGEKVELIFVEDTNKPELKEIVEEIGGRYFSKPNGNGGSVINFARQNQLIKTKYMAVVDPDDTIDLVELEALLKQLRDKDMYITNFNEIFLKSNVIFNRAVNVGKSFPFIHALGIKTSIFNGMNNLPENVFFTDNHFVVNVVSNIDSYEKIELSPYNYFLELEGQSMESSVSSLRLKAPSFLELSYIDLWMDVHNVKKNYSIINRYNMKHGGVIFIRNLYDNADRKELREIRRIYKSNFRGVKPIRIGFLGSVLYRFFVR